MSEENSKSNNVVSLKSFRSKKQKEQEEVVVESNKKQLRVDPRSGKITGSPYINQGSGTPEEFKERVVRIKSSLKRINALLDELKKMSSRESKDEEILKD